MWSEAEILESLEASARNGDLEQVKALVPRLQALGVETELERSDLEIALLHAVQNGHLAVAQFLLETCTDAAAGCFRVALRSDASDAMLDLLVQYGVDVNAYAEKHPLIQHTLGNRRHLAYLLDHAADPNQKDQRLGVTALDVAAAHYSLDVVQYLLARGATLDAANPLRSAAVSSTESDRVPILRFLIDDCRLDVNAVSHTTGRCVSKRGGENCTALQSAICAARKDRLQFLLSRGADPEVLSSAGENAFDYARRHGFARGLQMLEECLAQRSGGYASSAKIE